MEKSGIAMRRSGAGAAGSREARGAQGATHARGRRPVRRRPPVRRSPCEENEAEPCARSTEEGNRERAQAVDRVRDGLVESASGQPLALATSAARRARGLLLAAPGNGALLLVPCSDVHTVGMRRRLDIAFVDEEGRVLEAHRDVGPLRRLRNRRAVAVVERFSSCSSPWFAAGDRLALAHVREVEA